MERDSAEGSAAGGRSASLATEHTLPPLDARLFALLLDRIEHLSRELGRTEGRQAFLEQQIARLESQVTLLSRDVGRG